MKLSRAAGIAAVLVAVLCPAAAGAVERGEVGGPPTLKFNREPQAGKLTSPAIVIARSRSFLGPVEFVAYDTAGGCLTVELDVVRERSFSLTCRSDPGARGIFADGASWSEARAPGAGQFSVFLGGIGADVTRVRAEGRTARGRTRVKAIVARPGREILNRLDQEEPFSAWGVVLPGCVSGKRFTAEAFGPGGSLLDSTHDPNQGGGFFPCK
jgi:hypothetical protein